MSQEQQYAPVVVPTDGGPYYTETDLSRPVVEPWSILLLLAHLKSFYTYPSTLVFS